MDNLLEYLKNEMLSYYYEEITKETELADEYAGYAGDEWWKIDHDKRKILKERTSVDTFENLIKDTFDTIDKYFNRKDMKLILCYLKNALLSVYCNSIIHQYSEDYTRIEIAAINNLNAKQKEIACDIEYSNAFDVKIRQCFEIIYACIKELTRNRLNRFEIL